MALPQRPCEWYACTAATSIWMHVAIWMHIKKSYIYIFMCTFIWMYEDIEIWMYQDIEIWMSSDVKHVHEKVQWNAKGAVECHHRGSHLIAHQKVLGILMHMCVCMYLVHMIELIIQVLSIYLVQSFHEMVEWITTKRSSETQCVFATKRSSERQGPRPPSHGTSKSLIYTRKYAFMYVYMYTDISVPTLFGCMCMCREHVYVH